MAQLCIMLYRLFKKNLSSVDNILLKYYDDEGDLVTLESDIDISHALSLNNTLKIRVRGTYVIALISKTRQNLSFWIQKNLRIRLILNLSNWTNLALFL